MQDLQVCGECECTKVCMLQWESNPVMLILQQCRQGVLDERSGGVTWRALLCRAEAYKPDRIPQCVGLTEHHILATDVQMSSICSVVHVSQSLQSKETVSMMYVELSEALSIWSIVHTSSSCTTVVKVLPSLPCWMQALY